MDSYEYLSKVFYRLPQRLQEKYADRDDNIDNPTFSHMVRFVEKKAFLTATFYGRLLANAKARSKTRTISTPSSGNPKSSSFAITTSSNMLSSNEPPRKECPECAGAHMLYQCDAFKAKNLTSRREIVKAKKLCFNCLGRRHTSAFCPSTASCKVDGCGKRDHTLLHLLSVVSGTAPKSPWSCSPPPSGNGAGGNQASISAVHSFDNPVPVRLKVAAVEVSSGRSRPVLTHRFLDNGSNRSLCTLDLVKRLGITGSPESCVLNTANGPTLHKGMSVNLRIRGCNMPDGIDVANVFAIPSLPDVNDSIVTPVTLMHRPHLSDLDFPTSECNDVDILLGTDVLFRDPASDTRVGVHGSPTALKTMFGWALYGPDSSMSDSPCNLNFVSARPSTDPGDNASVCRLCGVDFVGVDSDPFSSDRSLNHKHALRILNETAVKVDGRYQIGLP